MPRFAPEARWRRYLRFWRPNPGADVADEFEFHLREHIDDLVARGMSAAAARDEARRSFGDIDQVQRTCTTLAEELEGDMRRSEMLAVVRQDATYALRLMRAHPTFTAAIVLTLALGIGATTAIFSVVNAVVLRPLPYANSERMVLVFERFRDGRGRASAGHYNDWAEQTQAFTAVAAFANQTFNLTDGEPTRVLGARVTPSFFQAAYMPPALGRYFLPTETEASHVVVLSHDAWRSHFGGDSAVLGREIALSGQRYTVVGVAPAAYTLTPSDERLWVPMSFTPERRVNYGAHNLTVFALLKPGVTLVQAQRDLERVTEGIRQRNPENMKDRGVVAEYFADSLLGGYPTQLWVLFAAVTFVLLIGCGNVASLLLARAMTRRKEIAIRGALGGGRARLVRQLLTESLMLAMFGGALGLLVARFGVRFLVRMGPASLPRLGDAGLSLDVLAFAAGATVLCGILFGLAPALRATRVDLQSELRDGGRGSRGLVRDRLRAALIVGEFAVALVLLVGAGLFIRSAAQLQRVTTGFDPSGVTMLRVALPADRYDSATAVTAAFTRIVDQVRAIPGVRSAAAGTRVPMWGASIDIGVKVDGRPEPPGRMPPGHVRLVSSQFTETVGIPLKRGRRLRDSDLAPGAPWVVVVNEEFARGVFGTDDPIGQRISGWTREADKPEWREIVGVIGNVRAFGREIDVPGEIYMPFTQAPAGSWNSFQRAMTIVAKTAPGATIAPALRQAVKSVDASLPLYDLQTMDDVLSRSSASRRFNTLLLSLLGTIGLLLSAIGIYGVIAFFVSQRTHEIGVRIALGATTGSVIRIVVRQALVLAVLGIAMGGVAAFWATRVVRAMLFEVDVRDPVTFGAGALVLLVVAIGAAWLPARRAARVDPIRALASSN
jgi:predicted permease